MQPLHRPRLSKAHGSGRLRGRGTNAPSPAKVVDDLALFHSHDCYRCRCAHVIYSIDCSMPGYRRQGGKTPRFLSRSGFSRNSVAVCPITCTTAEFVASASEFATSFGLMSSLLPSFTFTSSRVRNASSSEPITDGVRPC